jgi:hypothetical protein
LPVSEKLARIEKGEKTKLNEELAKVSIPFGRVFVIGPSRCLNHRLTELVDNNA